MIGYIYLNSYPNGYLYVGQHTYNKKEVDSSYFGSSRHAKQYGWVPNKIEILEYCDTRDELNEAERFWIKRYLDLLGVAPCVRRHNPNMAKSFVDGWMINEQMGGYQISSEETNRKRGESNRGRHHSDETKKKIGEKSKGRQTFLGKHHSEETRKKLAEYHKGKSPANKGVPMTDEQKRKMSELAKGRVASEETRLKQSLAHKGRKMSEESIRKSAEKRKKAVVQYSVLGELIKEWDSAISVQRCLNINRCQVTNCCKGKNKTAGGFVWKYKD